MQPLRYLMLCDGLGLGGLELQVLERVIDANAGGDYAILGCSQRGKLWEHARTRGVAPRRLEFHIPYYDPFAIYRLAKLLKQEKIDVCVVAQSHLLSQVLIARKIWNLPVAVVFYQMMQSGHPKRDWFHNRVYSSLDAAIVLTDRMKQELARTTIMPPERIFAVPFGIHSEQFSPVNKSDARDTFQIPQDAYVVGCVARLDPQKDQMLLVEAFAASVRPPDAMLILAGDATAGHELYKTSLTKRAEELGIGSAVRFIPFIREVPKLFASFDVFVLPSRSETFGLVIVEAMAAGLPVVATDSGGVPEIVDPGRSGLLFRAGDAEGLAQHLTQLAGSADLRQHMGAEGQKAARARFDYTRQTEAFFRICREAHAQSVNFRK